MSDDRQVCAQCNAPINERRGTIYVQAVRSVPSAWHEGHVLQEADRGTCAAVLCAGDCLRAWASGAKGLP